MSNREIIEYYEGFFKAFPDTKDSHTIVISAQKVRETIAALQSQDTLLGEVREGLEILANADADDGAGNIITPEVDRLGSPVILRPHEIAKQLLERMG